jgi:uncharacterized membrane protein YqaE (UPF0057 family)
MLLYNLENMAIQYKMSNNSLGAWGSVVTPEHRGLWGSEVTPSSDDAAGYDETERNIRNRRYKMADKVLYGGLLHGSFVLPTNFFKVVFTTIFPPLGEIINTMSVHLLDEFPYITWKALGQIIKNIDRVIISLILTSMLYIPGLIYVLSNITHHRIDKTNATNRIIKIKKY